MDRGITLADGCEVPNKEKQTPLNAYTSVRYARQGPAKYLYVDGGGAFNNDDAKAQLKRLDTELRIRAPGQHASYMESRNGILRHTHCIF